MTEFLSLEYDAQKWAQEIIKKNNDDREQLSKYAYFEAQKYDIEKNVKKLEKDYIKMIGKI
jgi:hypothetical protein